MILNNILKTDLKYERLKITAHLKTAVVINDLMYFDGILLHSATENSNKIRQKRITEHRTMKIRLPLARRNRCYLASKARYKILRTDIIYWKKRFDTFQAEKWKDSQKIRTDSTKYKNYNMPMQVTIPKNMIINWIVIGDKKRIEELLKNVVAIGKKSSQGFGLIKKWEIEKTTKKGVRHFPVIYEKNLPKNETVEHTKCYPPYSITNSSPCVIRKF